MRVAGVGFGPRPDRRAVGIDGLDVHDSAASPAATAAAAVVVVVRVPAVTVVVALATRAATHEAWSAFSDNGFDEGFDPLDAHRMVGTRGGWLW